MNFDELLTIGTYIARREVHYYFKHFVVSESKCTSIAAYCCLLLCQISKNLMIEKSIPEKKSYMY